MKKLLLLALYVLIPSVMAAEPYFLTAAHLEPDNRRTYPLVQIINKEPVFFEISTSTAYTIDVLPAKDAPFNVTQAYQSWFENLNDYIVKQGRTEFAFMQDIINFGMSSQVAIETHDDEKILNSGLFIVFLPEEDPYWATLTRSALGTFEERLLGSFLYIKQDAPNDLQRVLTHEVGHSLSIGDSYSSGLVKENMALSSGEYSSIMDGARNTLSCDDADALANALYLTMKKYNPSVPDFEFKSFCQEQNNHSFVFRNGKLLDHQPVSIIKGGIYYFTQFCKNGDVHSVTEVDFRKPYPLATTAQNACESVPFALQPPAGAAPQQLVDLTAASRNKVAYSPNTVIYEYAPLIYREISFNNEVAKTIVKVKSDQGKLLYVYAILNERQAMVFSLADAFLLIYDVKNPGQYTARQNKTVFGIKDPQIVQQIDTLWETFSKENRYFFIEFASKTTPLQHMQLALQWQEYLQANYPNPDIKIKKTKINKKLEQELTDAIRQLAKRTPNAR